MAKDLLFEIGAEELPAACIEPARSQMKQYMEKNLAEQHLSYGAIRTYATPRRLAVYVEGLADMTEAVSEVHKGPSVSIAYDADGNPTKAAMGFARGKGLDVKDLVVKDGYIYGETKTEGIATETLLPELLSKLITSLSFPKSMHWGDLDDKFVRPVRWLVALFGNDVVDLSFAGVKSGRISRGHRVLGPTPCEIPNPSAYESALRNHFVIVNPEERRDLIVKQIEALAAKEKATVIWSDILDEIMYLVEYPTALCGHFDDSYLSLPEAAIITPMQDHQRYFPLRDSEGKLLPMFITVRNGNEEHLETVQKGNERVLRARLDDAKFFFAEDRKQPLGDRYEGLTKIVFQEGLGNLADKTERLKTLSALTAEQWNLGAEDKAVLARAAELAKMDLTTGMVAEFTELQGEMGKQYALLDGEKPAVAEAIFEQYLPRFAGDIVPETAAGKVLSMVDKIDTIVATFSRGLIPTGSQDPYALRRQSIGILQVLLSSDAPLSLRPIIQKSMELLHISVEKQDELLAQVEQFITLRLKTLLSDKGVAHPIVEFVLSNKDNTVYAIRKLSAALMENRIDENEALVQGYTRIFNLVKELAYTGVDESKLTEEAEVQLYRFAKGAHEAMAEEQAKGNFAAMVATPAKVVPQITNFFEAVMVMVDDEAVKHNRLQLLRYTYDLLASMGSVEAFK